MIIARLSEIWKEYQGKLDSKKLNEILDRGICYSEVKHESPILVTGINPSFRLGDVACYKPVTTFNYQWLLIVIFMRLTNYSPKIGNPW